MTFADGEFLSQQRLDGLGAHGSLKHHRVAAIFRQTFRSAAAREPTAWNNHWPPTLQRVRVGWLPP